jgi:hypothetical protein
MKIWIWQPDGEQFTRVFRLKSLDLSKNFISSLMLLHEQEPIVVARAWSEPATTNAPTQDELVEASLQMNKNPILLARMDYFSHLFSAPKFSPLLPTTYLPPPTYHLPLPPYLSPTSPLLTTTYQPLPPSLHRQSSRHSNWKQARRLQMLRRAVVRAEARSTWDPGKHLYFFFLFDLVELRCSAA